MPRFSDGRRFHFSAILLAFLGLPLAFSGLHDVVRHQQQYSDFGSQSDVSSRYRPDAAGLDDTSKISAKARATIATVGPPARELSRPDDMILLGREARLWNVATNVPDHAVAPADISAHLDVAAALRTRRSISSTQIEFIFDGSGANKFGGNAATNYQPYPPQSPGRDFASGLGATPESVFRTETYIPEIVSRDADLARAHFTASASFSTEDDKALRIRLTQALWLLAAVDERETYAIHLEHASKQSENSRRAIANYAEAQESFARSVIIHTYRALHSSGVGRGSIERCMEFVRQASQIAPNEGSETRCEAGRFRIQFSHRSSWDLVQEIRRLSLEVDDGTDLHRSNEGGPRRTILGAAFEIARLKATIRDLERQKVDDTALWTARVNELSAALARANTALTESNIATAKALQNNGQNFTLAALTVIVTILTSTFIGLGTLIAFRMYRLHQRKEARELEVPDDPSTVVRAQESPSGATSIDRPLPIPVIGECIGIGEGVRARATAS
jgi:hypothetical protein